MKRAVRAGGGNIFDQLALKLRETAVAAHLNSGSGVERFKVNQVSPLVIEHVDGDLILEDGDPDFTVSTWLASRRGSLSVGDQVWCLREDNEWHALTDTAPSTA